jgi:hypothetical protein
VSELWVQGAFPNQLTKDSLASLAAEGLFPPDLSAYLDDSRRFPANRLLFSHQSEALRQIAKDDLQGRKSLVITAGTGAGKTEAFLLPILSGLWSTRRKPQNKGMRCLILYPMNALVTDQVTRLYEWLKDQNTLSLFHFTSDTPEDDRQANRIGEPRWMPSRRRTRSEARASIPDIVITNYSMLEYMLCRPQDARFFGSALQYIVLDEAHLYTGMLAAEITLLLRRVRDRCGVAPELVTHLATSATLGGTSEDLTNFAATIFSVPNSSIKTIKGKIAEPDFRGTSEISRPRVNASLIADHSDLDFTTLTADGEFIPANNSHVAPLREVMSIILPAQVVSEASAWASGNPARFLKRCLEQIPMVHDMANSIYSKELVSVDELTRELWGEVAVPTRKATILLLRMSAVAREHAGDSPIVPHRLHFLVRAPEGLSACLNVNCSGATEFRIQGLGCLQSPQDRCVHCQSVTLPVHRCDSCGQWALTGYETEQGEVEPGHFASLSLRRYYLVTNKTERDLLELVIDPLSGRFTGFQGKGTRLFKAPCPEHGVTCTDPDKCTKQVCPHCGSNWNSLESDDDEVDFNIGIHPLRGAERIAVSVVAETALYGMNVYPEESRNWKPARGRRLLCFSDSRREAARLGPLLSSQHETWIVRAAIVKTLSRFKPVSSDYLRLQIQRYEADVNNPGLPVEDREEAFRKIHALKSQLANATQGIPFHDFAEALSGDAGIQELLDRESGEKHIVPWHQSTWVSNRQDVASHTQALIARELDNPIRKVISTEATALVEVVYPGLETLSLPASFSGHLPTERIRENLSTAWPGLVAALLDSARADRAVDWSQTTSGRKLDGESPFFGRWMSRDKSGWKARRFVGDEQRRPEFWQLRLWFVWNVLKTAGCPEGLRKSTALDLLRAAFDQLFEGAGTVFPWLRAEIHQVDKDEAQHAIQIIFDKISLRVPETIFRCPDTGTLWSRSVLGWGSLRGCLGNLVRITSQEADADRRWSRARRELRESPIFGIGLWGEEHSAQLSPDENKRRQLLFKEGARNLLSSTTTMELGIDIGGLNGVLLGNVPPGRANHMQRGGRAGRRSDGSSVVVTFARNRAFDREVFHHFKEFLQRPLRRPVVFLERERLVRRHLHAMLLSEFFSPLQPEFTGAMDAYANMGRLTGSDSPPKWEGGSKKPDWNPSGVGYGKTFLTYLDAIRSSRSTFRQRCKTIVTQTKLEPIIHDDEAWIDFMKEASSQFTQALASWIRDYDSLTGAWKDIPTQPAAAVASVERAKAMSIRYQIRALCDLTVIEWFADARFLPRYGFPIHLQRLAVRIPKDKQPDRSTTTERYRLQRQSLLALSEYVPGADVLVGGKIAVSRGVLKHWTDANRDEALGLQYWALKCLNGHTYLATGQEDRCRECDRPPAQPGQMLLFPRFGYITAAWEPLKQGHHLDRVGEVEVTAAGGFTVGSSTKEVEDYAGVRGLKASYYEDGELLLRNAGGKPRNQEGDGFAMCTRCGFAMSEESSNQKGIQNLPSRFSDHASVFSTRAEDRCWPKTLQDFPVLRNRVLAARERTDILILDWPGDISNEAALFSLGRALLLAGTRLLELDSRELGLSIKALRTGEPGILLYDTVPGGAGHCLELLNLNRIWLDEARNILVGSASHDVSCRRACLECLLDFAGQFYADRLDRKGALELLDAVV